MPIDAIRNYYEDLVQEQLYEALGERRHELGEDFLEDAACVALNHLPAKYVRHSVDLIFYMGQDELVRMRQAVVDAVATAIDQVEHHREGPAWRGKQKVTP